MKMHVLTTAVLAALASGSVLAASEGADTWSTVQPVQHSTYSAVSSASRLDVAFHGSEGGDTWSSVQPLPGSFAPSGSTEDRAKPEAARLGDHPAVIVARRGVQVDPASKFYLHPARLSWSLQRPLSEGEHPAVIVARGGFSGDPASNFYLHPARLSWSLQRPPSEDEPRVVASILR